MNTEWLALRRLIMDVDDARILYRRLARHLEQPGASQLLCRLAQSHAVIAENLADRIHAASGGETARTGRRWRALRLGCIGLHAHFALDADLDRMLFVQRNEARVLRGFDDAIQDEHVQIRRRLQLYKRELEGKWGELGRLVYAMSGASHAHA